MISVEQAFKQIDTIQALKPIEIPLVEALNYTLAEDVLSPINMPPFNQSAMDGYAANGTSNTFELTGEIQAGMDASNIELKEGQAIRIFTGAMVPTSATTVIRQEIVEKKGDSISIVNEYGQHENIRLAGEQIELSELAAKKGTRITAGVLGFLVGIGIETVTVYRNPKIAVIATGNELVPTGGKLAPGKIYESNSHMIQASLKSIGFECSIYRVIDDFEETKALFTQLISENDLLIAAGGISVGDYDFVGKALEELNTETLFYKVKQKPGKPLYLGKNGSTIIFGLPGNPGAALSCFYIYVSIALAHLTGRKSPFIAPKIARLGHDYSKPAGLTQFLKANMNGNVIQILSHQSSAMLNVYADTNCIARLEEKDTDWKSGDEITVYLI
ncbi:MAG: molybdopterin molybdotransferase MoeA [Crocinitomicaceae bacterium]